MVGGGGVYTNAYKCVQGGRGGLNMTKNTHFVRRFIENATTSETIKPIFHQNAKSLASGTFASPNAKDSTFASPNARNTNMLVSLALGDASFLRWPCTFLFFWVDFFALGSKRNLYSSGI